MATQNKLLTDCYWFLLKQCSKGSSCEYRHCEAALENLTDCKFWAEGKCANKDCIFRHPSGASQKIDRSQIPCYYMLKGTGCMKGLSCPFSHIASTGTPALKDLEDQRKKHEEALRKLQQQTKEEEARLANVRSQREPTTTPQSVPKQTTPKASVISRLGPLKNDNKDQNKREAKTRDKNELSPSAQPFVKTVRQLQQELPKGNQRATRQEQRMKKQKTEEKTTEDSSKSTKIDFGVKTLEELRTDKQPSPPPTVLVETQAEQAKNDKKNLLDIETLRKKNELKFKQNALTEKVPKRKIEEPEDDTQDKRPKVVDEQGKTELIKKVDVAPAQIITPLNSFGTTATDPDDEFDLDEEIDIGTAELLDDKEFEELIQ